MSKARNRDHDPNSVRQAHIPPNLSSDTMSRLGRDLLEMSREYEASGGELLSEKEIEVELTRRRGGYNQDDDA